ncbi:MAG: DUF2878 family protein [Candidatus Pacebacteria bacterium]|nr:DUF2878 family protein [Candidatus Paceibacterota bacterium]
MNKKLLYTLFILLNVSAISLLQNFSLLVVLILSLAGYAVITIEKEKKFIPIYWIIFLGGPLLEAVAIHFGVWSYKNPVVIGVPLWLPFLWGNASLVVAKLTLTLTKPAK